MHGRLYVPERALQEAVLQRTLFTPAQKSAVKHRQSAETVLSTVQRSSVYTGTVQCISKRGTTEYYRIMATT